MNVLDLLIQKGIKPKKAASTGGGEYWSACPDCGGKDRFHVWPNQNDGDGSYWCRQCEKSGDNIQFLMDFEDMAFPQACKALDIKTRSRDFRRPNPKIGKNPQPIQKTSAQLPSDLWVKKARKFINSANENLLQNKDQMKWLADRGINTESVELFKLGWNLEDLWRPRESWGLSIELKDGRKKRLWLPMGLVIPFGVGPTRIRIRRPKGKPRYYVIPGSVMDVMQSPGNNKYFARAYVVVESELDCILVHQEAGDIISVIALGSTSAKPDRKTVKHLQNSAVILLSQDFDDAGRKALKWWQSCFPQIKRWPVHQGKDPGELYQAGGNIRMWIIAGLPRGWFIGPSLLERRKRAVDNGLKSGSEVTASVLELAELLKKHPVVIRNTPDRLTVCESQAWVKANWEVSKRISELVYMTPEVFEYISAHPAEIIDSQNIWKVN